MTTESLLKQCVDSLTRVQTFDASMLSREDDLGKQMSFAEAVKPAEAIISLYKRIPLSSLQDFADNQLNAIHNQTNTDFNVFKQILDFNAAEGDAVGKRSRILESLQLRRDQLFEQVWQYVAYGVARTTDTSILENQARATIQTIKDQAERLTEQLNQAKADADTALAAIRAVAFEQGVSQQAHYFKEESQVQDDLADKWLVHTYRFAMAVGGFAVLSLVLHKLPWIRPENATEAVQVITSKILIFTVLGFLLVLAAKNYANHKHNSVVNKHRQNALLTYQALVAASAEDGTEDIVLAHAAACIFSPQETGFSQGRGEGSSGPKSVLELFTKSASKSGE
jgi:hypothetical protein